MSAGESGSAHLRTETAALTCSMTSSEISRTISSSSPSVSWSTTESIEPVVLEPVVVSNFSIEQQSLEFDVDRVGVPVLVKVSYFPNWKASGAEGPWRIGPNMMVVVPTDTHVELSYGRRGIDYAAIVLTLIGIGLCVWWRREGDLLVENWVFVDIPHVLTQMDYDLFAEIEKGAT